jgi:uroporphyrinogen-III synthase
VGKKTCQELEQRGLPVSYVPERFSAQSLSEHFSGPDVTGKRFLWPRGNLGRDELADALRERGALVDAVTVYTTTAVEDDTSETIMQQLADGEIDIITFASPSAAVQFAKFIPPGTLAQYRHRAKIAVIGPTTEKAVIELGFSADIVAQESTAKGLVDAIEKYLG